MRSASRRKDIAEVFVERGHAVRIHYDLTDSSGIRIGSTREGEPRVIRYGQGSVLPGIERALAGRPAGDRFRLVLQPEEAFGLRLEGAVRRVSKKYIAGPKRLVPGMTVFLATRAGHRPVRVLKVGSSVVDIDANHPLAGITIHADVEIVDIRATDPEEASHGHVHRQEGAGHRADNRYPPAPKS